MAAHVFPSGRAPCTWLRRWNPEQMFRISRPVRQVWTPSTGYRPRGDNPHKRSVLRLRDGAEQRVRDGYPWIFPRDVRNQRDLEAVSPCLVNVETSSGYIVGTALYNARASIAARVVSAEAFVPVNATFFAERLRACLAYREQLYPEPFYRLVHGEADGLPGIAIDRYGDHVVIQATAAGVDALLWPITDAVEEVLKPKVVILRQDAPGRKRVERSPVSREVLRGHYTGPTELRENGVTFVVDLLKGQKTGWYYDLREQRKELATLAMQTPRVLDLYSYVGGFGMTCAQYGAEEVVCVDSSESALELCLRAAAMNSLSGRVRTTRSDVVTFLEELAGPKGVQDKEVVSTYDLVILDPPNLGMDRGHVPGALRLYERLTCAAARICARPGFLFVASCTYHVGHHDMMGAVARGLRWAGRPARLVSTGGQGPDHPGHPMLPETRYLNTLLFHLE